MNKQFNFGKAVELLKEGIPVQRYGWNGKGLFVFAQVPAKISIKDVVPKMQSLPNRVKEILMRRFDSSAHGYPTIDYSNQLALVKMDNTVNGWAPSTADALAEDWCIFDE